MIAGYFEAPPHPAPDLLWRTAEARVPETDLEPPADVTILMINPALSQAQRQTRVQTAARWSAQVLEVADPLDGLVRAAEIQPDMLVIDLDTPTFDVAEVLRAVKRSRYFAGQTTLAVATDLDRADIAGQSEWPAGVLLLRRSPWLAALGRH